MLITLKVYIKGLFDNLDWDEKKKNENQFHHVFLAYVHNIKQFDKNARRNLNDCNRIERQREGERDSDEEKVRAQKKNHHH